jgi:hypothetical protein
MDLVMNNSTAPVSNVDRSKPASITEAAAKVESPPESHPAADAQPRAAGSVLKLRSAFEIATDFTSVDWLLRPYLECNSICLLFGEFGTFKTFLALDWALRIASGLPALGGVRCNPKPVVYLSAEGRGLGKRLRGWAKHNLSGAESLNGLQFYAIERPVNLSAKDAVAQVVAAIDDLKITPGFIVVDTISRNSDGRVEASNENAAEYLNMLDTELRIRYQACILLVHHVGHRETHRARGAYALMGNTESYFLVERPKKRENRITVTCGRMKDCETPEATEFNGISVDLGEIDESGEPVTTLVLEPCGTTGSTAQRRPNGPKQLLLLEELERRQKQSDSDPMISEDAVSRICHSLGFHRNTAREAKKALVDQHFLVLTEGGYSIAVQ